MLASVPAPVPPLVREAMRKAGVVWIAGPGDPCIAGPGGDRPQLCWVHWTGEAAYVVTGPGEQPDPGLVPGRPCDVTVRAASTGARILTWSAIVERVGPGTAEWERIVPALVVARLNAPEHHTLAQRWAGHNTLSRLVPSGGLSGPDNA